MSDSLGWLAQTPKHGSFADVTFVREGLALSNLMAPNNPQLLERNGIRSILSLFGPTAADLDVSAASEGWVSAAALQRVKNLVGRGEVPHPDLLKVGVEKRIIFPIRDDETNSPADLRRAVEILGQLHAQFAPVLVHCRFGASRTPAVAGCYLAQKEGISFRAALDEIGKLRPISISDGLALSIVEAIGINIV